MSAEGRLDIRVTRAGRGDARATIRSSRPASLANVLVGRDAASAVRLLPQLYSVCGVAQGVAAATAGERALGMASPAGTALARKLLVAAETWREHLLRIQRDWPQTDAGMSARLPEVMQPLPELLARASTPASPLALGARTEPDAEVLRPPVAAMGTLSEELVLGEPPTRFLERESLADLEAWCLAGATPAARTLQDLLRRGWQSAGNGATSFLPPLADDELLGLMLGDGAAAFTAAPTWEGRPRETSTYSRQAGRPLVRALAARCGNGLLTRMAALLVEVASLPVAMHALLDEIGSANDAPQGATEDGAGIAQVEAARGRLAHGVEIRGGVVARYSILAPTEWNFHAEGAAARGLESLHDPDPANLSRQAELLIHAIDPCVGYRLEWADA
ncbi:MAG: nickel-dependent hydrogenase large subunit [Gammaproteobacteria bacterium]|nr:nickel-dependent hydrogenase large subunit [Gammaproteobacteria bacterium]